MKSRIIATLVGFSSEVTPERHRHMLEIMISETGLSEEKIKSRSKEVLKYMLHHYAQFSVETIDHFNHRLIRTFARDLKLPQQFEVSLDIKELISQAVDQLIDSAGEDPEITKLLLEFALQKTDDDRSWDIAIDLKKVAGLLANENDATHLQLLKDKTLSDFLSLRNKLQKESQGVLKLIRENGQQTLALFAQHELTEDHFSGKYLYRFFEKIAEGILPANFNAGYLNTIDEKPMYAVSKVKGATAALMDSLAPQINEQVSRLKEKVARYLLIENILKNLVPLATVNLVNQELQKIKEEESILPINEFNTLIHEQVKDQPAPFIYERLGDRYRDFFIDEFQDTSYLQWHNLIPLIENALSQGIEDEPLGSLLLVGDAKQSIYRWRGGLPEQFINLTSAHSPFSAVPTVLNLETNYRSKKEIISFNNAFFSFIAKQFDLDTHQHLYAIGNKQLDTGKEGGLVQIEFLPTEKDAIPEEKETDPHALKVHQTVNDLLALGYRKNDICVLTRTKNQGVSVSEYLLEQDIDVVSEETLLLKNAPSVQCIVNVLQLSITPTNEEVKIQVLTHLFDQLEITAYSDQHHFFQSHIHAPLQVLSDTLKNHGIDFDFKSLQHLSLFESMEHIIEHLKLNEKADSFLSSFVDLVFTFSQQTGASKNSFLYYWEAEMDRASISENKSTDAVRVMTIHKSKGLEFPIVIFPYANLDIYKELFPTAWYPYADDNFDELLINFKTEVADYGAKGAQMALERNRQLELDNFNLLYVVLTRPVEQLYIFADDPNKKHPPKTYGSFLYHFLVEKQRWEEGRTTYAFGASEAKSVVSDLGNQSVEVGYPVSSPASHHIKVVTSEVESAALEHSEAIAIGNLLHDTMALIKTSEDMEPVLSDLEIQLSNDPEVFSEIKKRIVAIVKHQDLSHLFAGTDLVYNERDIITPERILRPDRVNLHKEGAVTVVDYKTGAVNEAYEIQIGGYAMVLQDMGYTIKEKLLVYSNTDGISINKT